jgi:hypothetical protein
MRMSRRGGPKRDVVASPEQIDTHKESMNDVEKKAREAKLLTKGAEAKGKAFFGCDA